MEYGETMRGLVRSTYCVGSKRWSDIQGALKAHLRQVSTIWPSGAGAGAGACQ